MDYIKPFIDLAQAFFKAFAHAVVEYPLPTAVVFALSFLIVWPDIRKRYEDRLIIAGIVQFVLTVFAANVIGWLFNASLWMAKALIGATQFSASIFADHPIEFIEHLLAWSVVAAIALLYLANWRYRSVHRMWICFAILPLLWITYISTNVHTHITKTVAPTAPVTKSSKP